MFTRFNFALSCILALLCMSIYAEGNGGEEAEAEKKQRLDIDITVESASIDEGIGIEVKMTNNSNELISLDVCPNRKLCCVKKLHPLIEYNDTGMGLADWCEGEAHKEYKTALPTNTSFISKVVLSPDCLPENCLKAGQEITVQFCYELGESKLVHSDSKTVAID